MSRITEDVRIGLSVLDFQSFWSEHGEEVTGARRGEETPDGGLRWSREGVRGVMHPTADDGSTLLRITIEADDARSELDELFNRLSHALDDSDTISGASFSIEPSAGEAPDEETSADQPL